MTCHLSSLFKSEDPAEYASKANNGMMLAFPVSINGESTRQDNGIGYHATIKVFDKDKDHGHAIHNLAQHLPLNPPDAKNTQIEPGKFQGKNGDDIFVIKLHGNSAEKMKELNGKFAGMGDPVPYEFQAHISVSKELHDKIKASGAKTAHEAGIEFGNAELKRGPKTIKTYHHHPDSAEPRVPDEGDMTAKMNYEPQMGKLAASEKDSLCPMHKAEKLKPLMKPFVSDAQRRWGHTAEGEKALGGKAGVHEWDEATKGKKLPEKVSKKEVPLEKGALRTAAIGAAALLSSHANAASGHLHQFISGLNGMHGIKSQSSFNPAGKNPKNMHGEGRYKINVGNYTIHGTHNSNGAGYNHKIGMDGPKKPTSQDLQDEKKALFLRDKLNTTGNELLEKGESILISLEKGALKNAGIALGMAGALAGGTNTSDAGNRAPASIQQPKPQAQAYDHGRMLRAMAQVESRNGADTNHKPAANGEVAYGKYALMPNTIHDTIKGHKDLKTKHGKALALTGQNLSNYMRDNKGLEDTIADRHLTHIEHRLGKDPEQAGYAWFNGISGALKAKKNKQDIKNHFHVKKIREAYDKEK